MKAMARIAMTLLLAGIPATPVFAQVQIETQPRGVERPARVITPPLRYETTRPSDADFYPQPPRVPYDPAFIEPLAARYETPSSTGEIGISGWTSPNTPVGPAVGGFHDVNGWFALGFSITWGGPPPAKLPTR